MRVVVADSGPLIIFARTCGLDLLCAVVNEILLPPAVARECTRDLTKPGAATIQAAIDRGALRCATSVDLSILTAIPPLIDLGESEAIALAKAENLPVLIDERIGREVAKQQGVPRIGSIGILLQAKNMSLVAEITPILEMWKIAGYRLSAGLLSNAIRLAGEDNPS
jgi:predicted nucleic acid-binding protein